MLANGLGDPAVELVHAKSAEILSEVGFCVPEHEALTRLEAAGFLVNWESQMVRVTPEILSTALARMPQDIWLYDRSGQKAAPWRQRTCFMTSGSPVNVLDLETGARRLATRQDVRRLVRLQDALPQVDIVRPSVCANDYGQDADLVEFAELLRGTAKPIAHRTLSPENVDAAAELLAVVAGGAEELRARPRCMVIYCPISPGYWTPANIRNVLRWAEHGLPTCIMSMAMAGASSPATLLGELVVINADVLAWLVVLKILYPGLPLVYGCVASVLDMRTGALPLGAPERGVINAGAARMARFYGIPSLVGGLSSDARCLDAQAGFEKAVTAIPLMLEGASMIFGIGITDLASSISYTQMILDNEMIGALHRMMQGIAVHDLDEEVALIKAKTPRGSFLGTKHTRRAFREHWMPEIFSREAYGQWQAKGETLDGICRRKARAILDEHRPEPLSTEVEAEMERIVRRSLGPEFHLAED
jgi:trimethylamine--corrinoid protein Co-methyltransferase